MGCINVRVHLVIKLDNCGLWKWSTLLKNPDVVYIGMCDWGEARCLKKVMPSLYGFAKEQDATNAKKKKKKVPVSCPNFLFTTSQELQILFDDSPSNTPQL
jgi:hypothetical protein